MDLRGIIGRYFIDLINSSYICVLTIPEKEFNNSTLMMSSFYLGDQSRLVSTKKMRNMQDQMKCDWFKPSNHEVIQKHSTSEFATKFTTYI